MKFQDDFPTSGIAVLIAISALWLPGTTVLAQAPLDDPAIANPNIESIVVEARRFAEPISETPLAVTAVTGDDLERIGAVDLGSLEMLTPNLSLDVGDASNALIYVRGIGQRDSLSFADPGVAVYLDDVYLGRAQGSFLELFDVNHIEVLRGPQGTLYGRNTIGGAIKYVSVRPDPEFSADLEAGIGNYGQRELSAVLNLPLGESVSSRFSLGRLSRDGWSENLANGADDGDKALSVFRGQLLFDDGGDFDLEVSVDYSDNDPDTSVTPSVEAVSIVGQLLGLEDANPGPFKVNADFNHEERLTTRGFSITPTWRVNDVLSLKSISSWREIEHDSFLDLDGDDVAAFGVFVHQQQEQFSQELQALFEFDAGATLVTGLYYFDEADITPDGVFGPEASIAFFGIPGFEYGLSTASTNDLATESRAVFGELTLPLAENLELTAGARYTSDDKRLHRVYNGAIGFGNPGITLADLADAATLPFSFTTQGEKTFSAFSPKLGISYRPNEELLVYLNASRGFKSGGFNGRSRDDNEAEPYDEEFVTSIEAGLKRNWQDGRFSLHAAAFRNDYEDMQLSSFGSANASFIAIFSNAGEAVTQGFELEFSAAPSSDLRISAFAGFLDAKYKEYNAPNLGTGEIQDLSHLDLIQAPEFTWGAGASWNAVGTADWSLTLSGQIRGSSSYFTTIMNEPSLMQDDYAIANFTAWWEHFESGFHARLAVTNITDEAYIVHGFDLLSYPGVALSYYGPPRGVSLTVGKRF